MSMRDRTGTRRDGHRTGGRLRAGAAVIAAATLAIGSPGAAQAQGDGWELDAINASAANDASTGEGVVVAVVDTGVGEHPDLDGKVIDGWGAPGVDDPREDLDGHGTAVAGKVAEVAPDAQIMPVRYTTTTDTGTSASAVVAEGITWAVDNGADIANISSTSDIETPELRDAVQYALDNDVVVVAASGNDPDADIGEPASYAGVVTVTGTDTADESWDSATTGPETAVAAPADVMSTLVPQEGGIFADEEQPLYEDSTGTSLGAPMVAGVAALIRAEHPDLDAANVINRLVTTAVDLGDSGRDDTFGYGLVDAAAAVTADVAPVDANPLGDPGGASADGEPSEGADGATEPAGDDQLAAEDGDDSGSSTSLIIGIAAGVVILGAIVAVLVWRARKRSAAQPSGPGGPPMPAQYPGAPTQTGGAPGQWRQPPEPPTGEQQSPTAIRQQPGQQRPFPPQS